MLDVPIGMFIVGFVVGLTIAAVYVPLGGAVS